MSEYIDMLVLLVEILTVLIYMHISFMQKVHWNKYIIIVLSIAWGIYWLINKEIISQTWSLPVYLLIWMYCYFRFKLTIGKTMVRFLLALIIAAFVETLLICMVASFKNADNAQIVLSLISVISLIIAIIIYVIVLLRFQRTNYLFGKSLTVSIILIGSVFVILIFDYYMNNAIVRISTIIIIALVIVLFVYTLMLEKSEREVESKKFELELQTIYGGAYEELLTEVRRRQHDFKNQLGALYSMHLVAESLEDLKTMQKEYGDNLIDGCRYDSILTCCDNHILAGYIYYRCISCEKEGVEVIYRIHMGDAECSFALYEIIEVLGILIDNACENIASEGMSHKRIKLDMFEDEEQVSFSVSNPSKYLTSSEIENMFKQGYSTKGKNRGIGLARVRELVMEHDEEIHVRNYTDTDINWIEFKIIATK